MEFLQKGCLPLLMQMSAVPSASPSPYLLVSVWIAWTESASDSSSLLLRLRLFWRPPDGSSAIKRDACVLHFSLWEIAQREILSPALIAYIIWNMYTHHHRFGTINYLFYFYRDFSSHLSPAVKKIHLPTILSILSVKKLATRPQTCAPRLKPTQVKSWARTPRCWIKWAVHLATGSAFMRAKRSHRSLTKAG